MKSGRKYIDIKKIPEYWHEQGIEELYLNFDWSDALETPLCFCCASRKRLERAHIIPHSLGGSNDVSNYVILCKDCHNEAPDTTNPNDIWDWIYSHKCDVYMSIDDKFSNMNRGFLLKSLYFLKEIKNINDLTEEESELLFREVKNMKNKVSSHAGKIKPSTFEYFFKDLVKRLKHRQNYEKNN